MTTKEAPTLTGPEAIHNEALAAALTAIDVLVQQEIGEGEYDEDDLTPLVTARVALTGWAEQEAAEYDDDNGAGYGNSVISANAKPSMTRKSGAIDKRYTTFGVNAKALDTGTGEIEAVANTLSVVDMQKDQMEFGCWADVIGQMKVGQVSWPTLFWGHDLSQPVGKVDYAEERGNGLYVKGRFNLGTTRGRDAYSDVKFGAISQLSVGFLTAPDGEHYDHKGIRHITKVATWFDVSFVVIGASPNTRVMSLKDAAVTEAAPEWLVQLLGLPEDERERIIGNVVVEEVTNAMLRDTGPLDPELKALIKRFVNIELERLEQPAGPPVASLMSHMPGLPWDAA